MIKKTKISQYTVDEHLEHWVTETNYSQRLSWLEEANVFVGKLKRKKNYPDLSIKKK